MSRKFPFVVLLAFLTCFFCRAEFRLAKVETNQIFLVVLDDEGNTKSAETCTPQLPTDSRMDFNQAGKGILIEPGATNQVSPETSAIISSLNLTYGFDLIGLPETLLSNKVEFAVRSFRGDKLAV